MLRLHFIKQLTLCRIAEFAGHQPECSQVTSVATMAEKLMLNILWQENKIYTFQTVQMKDMSWMWSIVSIPTIYTDLWTIDTKHSLLNLVLPLSLLDCVYIRYQWSSFLLFCFVECLRLFSWFHIRACYIFSQRFDFGYPVKAICQFTCSQRLLNFYFERTLWRFIHFYPLC